MISFVIPAFDEELQIGRTLGALADAVRELGEPHEIIVVDDGSRDRTAEIAEREGARVVRVHHRHIAATRNAGGRAARGDQLVFIDADTRVNAMLLRAALEALRRGAAGGGCTVRFDDPVPLWGRLLAVVLVTATHALRLAPGCFVFCTRAAFETTGGFDEKLFGAEELAFSQALKRCGRFVILRQTVLTSGRKLRTYSGREILQLLGRLASRGPTGLGSRELLGAWYEPRRPDPGREQRSA